MKGVIVGIVGIVLVGLGAYFYLEGGNGAAIRAAETVATPLPAVTVDGQIVVDAVIAPARHVALSMATSGLVAEVLVREGDEAAAGQVIARLDNAQQLVAIAQAQARLRAVQATYDELAAGPQPQAVAIAQAALDVAQANLMKLTDAPPTLDVTALDLNVSKIIAEADIRRAQAELELKQMGASAEALTVAEAEVAEAQADLKQRELELAATELQMPFTGVIAALDLEIGTQVLAGTPVVQVADFTTWQIKTDGLTELNVVHVKEGMTVTVTVDALPELVLHGTLLHIRPLGENKQGQITYTAIVQPAQTDPRLRWNMTAAVIIDPERLGPDLD